MPRRPRSGFPNLHRQVTERGKTVWYYRRDRGGRTRIHGVFGSPEFLVAYHLAALRELGLVVPWEGRLKIKRKRKPKPKKRQPFFFTREWNELRYRALVRSGGRCECCGAGKTLHVDHIKPRSKYPELALELANLQVLCGNCNLGKGAWDETDWRPGPESQAIGPGDLVAP